MATKKTKPSQNGLATITKDAVTATKGWTLTVRDVTWGPWIRIMEDHEVAANSVLPWVEMTRSAQDQWLDFWETQTHEVIDQTIHWMDRP